MYSIQNQKRDVIYYRPNVKKFYIAEKIEMISDNFWTNAPVYCMPEDEAICQ